MFLHEWQTKKLFAGAGVKVLEARLAKSPDEASAAARALGGPVFAVKAQVLAGGRGKAGGVKIVSSPDEASAFAASLIGKRLKTAQTGPAGERVDQVLVEKGAKIEKEFYLSLLMDGDQIVFVSSGAGGVDIEKTALEAPEKIHKQKISLLSGVQPFHAQAVCKAFQLEGKLFAGKLLRLLSALYKLMLEKDLSLVEINPLILDSEKDFAALDGKAKADENSFFRQKALFEFIDRCPEDPGEALAKQLSLAYIKLEGNIACMVNGAGLAMATMDLIRFHGGSAANFLDVGGGAEEEKVISAFKIILKDAAVRAIMVNIFGGIMHCDVIAKGLIKAASELKIKTPLIVRLEGTRASEGRALLKSSSLKIDPAASLNEAALKAVKCAASFKSA